MRGIFLPLALVRGAVLCESCARFHSDDAFFFHPTRYGDSRHARENDLARTYRIQAKAKK